MRINKQKYTNKQKLITLLIVVLVSACAALGWVFLDTQKNKDRPENTIDYQKPTSAQKKSGSEAKENFLKNQENRNNKEDNSQTSSGDSSSISITITSATAQDGTLQVRSLIETTQSSGVCKITLSQPGSQKIIQTANSQIMGSYSVCQGFNIPTGELAKGEWTVRIDFESSIGNGSAEKKVEIT